MSTSKTMAAKKDSTLSPTKPKAEEMVVTRNKSAQFKRKLRNIDRSMKRITQLLMKSPSTAKNTKNITSESKRSPKNKKNKKKIGKHVPVKKPEKLHTIDKLPERKTVRLENKEYYPDKLKRKKGSKKVFLKPTQELKMIGTTRSLNKRKVLIPRKDMKDLLQFESSDRNEFHVPMCLDFDMKDLENNIQNPIDTELSIKELVRLTEDCQELTDEDFMEILTCPSPVWWEDPPTPYYIEDAIFSRSPPHTIDNIHERKENDTALQECYMKNNENLKNTKNNSKITQTSLEKCDKRYLEKRNKLESVLGNIKNKVLANVNDIPHSDMFNHISNNQQNVIHNLPSNSMKLDKNKELEICIDDAKSKATSCNSNISPNKSDSIEDLLSDTTIHDEEMLKDLENMDIPIEETGECNENNVKSSSPNDCVMSNEVKANEREAVSLQFSNSVKHISQEIKDTNIDFEDYLDTFLLEGVKKESQKDKIHSKKSSKSNIKTIEEVTTGNILVTEAEAFLKKPKIKKKSDLKQESPKKSHLLQKLTIVKIEKDLCSSSTSSSKSVISEETIETESNVSTTDMMDTISDTNICFITDDEINESGLKKSNVAKSNIDNSKKIEENEIETTSTDSNQDIKIKNNNINKPLSDNKTKISVKSEKQSTSTKVITDKEAESVIVYKIIDTDIKTLNKAEFIEDSLKYGEINEMKSEIEKKCSTKNKTKFNLSQHHDEKNNSIKVHNINETESLVSKIIDDDLKQSNTGEFMEINLKTDEIDKTESETVKKCNTKSSTRYNLRQHNDKKNTLIAHTNKSTDPPKFDKMALQNELFKATEIFLLNEVEDSNEYQDDEEENTKITEKSDSGLQNGKLINFYRKCKAVNRKRTRNKSETTSTNKDLNILKTATFMDIASKIYDSSSIVEGSEIKVSAENKDEDRKVTICESCDRKTKSIVVSDSNSVKYCLTCSSIFDTEDCIYCKKKQNVKEQKISCNSCDLEYCCITSFQHHEKTHDAMEIA